jgi:hypothetical protein
VSPLGANMWKKKTIVLKPFLDFIMDHCFKFSKVHNMFTFMLDPWFKDLNFEGDHVGQTLTIDIVVTYDGQFFLLTFMILY